jgi:hypothetical protein
MFGFHSGCIERSIPINSGRPSGQADKALADRVGQKSGVMLKCADIECCSRQPGHSRSWYSAALEKERTELLDVVGGYLCQVKKRERTTLKIGQIKKI